MTTISMEAPTLERPRPTLLTPRAPSAIEGSYATFEWHGVAGATRYHLQVGVDADFDRLLVDAELDETTSLTVYEMLPEDGSIFFWRVRAGEAAGWFDWSSVESFRAVTDTEAAQARSVSTAGRSVPRREARPETVVVPFERGRTSRGQSLYFGSLVLVNMLIMVGLLVLALMR